MRSVLLFLFAFVVAGLALWTFILRIVRLVEAIRWCVKGAVRGAAIYSALKDLVLALAFWAGSAFVLEKLAPDFAASLARGAAPLLGAMCAAFVAAGVFSESGRTDLAKSCWLAFSKHVSRQRRMTDSRLCTRLWRAAAWGDAMPRLVRTLVVVFDVETNESSFPVVLKEWASEMRAECAVRLGETGEQDAFPLLRILTGDTEGSVCEKAAEALARLGGPRAIEILAVGAAEWRQRGLGAAAGAAVRSLARMGAPAVAALIKLYESGVEEYLVIEALAEIGSAEAKEGLLRIVGEQPNSTGMHAAEKLDQMDRSWVTRSEARSLFPHLIKTLVDRDAVYHTRRDVARQYLDRIDPDWPNSKGAKETVESLVEALLSPAGEVREEALSVLGRIREDWVVEPLLNLARRHVSNPLAIGALAAHKDPRATEFLLWLVYADDPDRSEIGSNALSALLPPDVLREHIEEARKRREERAEEARKRREEHAMEVLRRAMTEFTRHLRAIAGFEDPLEGIADGVPPPDDITWDNSEALRNAKEMALGRLPESRALGIAELEDLIRRHPSSAAPYGLLAQALWGAARRDEAQRLLLRALPEVAEKSEIFDTLALQYNTEGEHPKAVAYYLLAAYAMGRKSTLWGGVIYLSGVYDNLDSKAARVCRELAAAMRGGNPVALDRQQAGNISLAVQSNEDVRALARSAWEGFLESKTRQMMAERAQQLPSVSTLPPVASRKPAEGFRGHCQSCGKSHTAFKVMAKRAFFLCSSSCEDRYGHLRAMAIRQRDVNVVADATGTLNLERLMARREQAKAAAFCWFCGARIRFDVDVCPSCNRSVDVLM
jgi:hypothetical protein